MEDDPLARAYNNGLALEAAGDLSGAAASYRAALQLDPADHGGVAVRLAAMGLGEVPDRAPSAYVTTLFDQHAEAFDAILVDQLGYRVPWQIAEALAPHAPYARMLDLGCGTGLSALTLQDLCGEMTGVDLAEDMLTLADERDLYDALYVGDAAQFLAEEDTRFDLIVATDVLPYLGDLAAFFDGLAACLTPGGIVALSSERASDAKTRWAVGRKHRFCHGETYLRGLLSQHALFPLVFDPITVRTEDGAPVPGDMIIARKG